MKGILFLALLLSLATIPMSYAMFHRVEQAGQRIEELRVEIEREREAVRVLRAEWAFLNRGDRLIDLVERHHHTLLLEPVLPRQLAPGPLRDAMPGPAPRTTTSEQGP